MSGSRPPAQFRDIAGDLLVTHGADFSDSTSTLEAANGYFEIIRQRLSVLIGNGGMRSLMELAHTRAIAEHPALEAVVVAKAGDPTFQRVPSSGPGDADLSGAFVDLLAHFLVLLRNLARDQDWTVVDLWPGMETLESASLLRRPRKD